MGGGYNKQVKRAEPRRISLLLFPCLSMHGSKMQGAFGLVFHWGNCYFYSRRIRGRCRGPSSGWVEGTEAEAEERSKRSSSACHSGFFKRSNANGKAASRVVGRRAFLTADGGREGSFWVEGLQSRCVGTGIRFGLGVRSVVGDGKLIALCRVPASRMKGFCEGFCAT